MSNDNNKAELSAEEYKLAFQYELENPPNLTECDRKRDFIAGIRHTASALAEKDREIERLKSAYSGQTKNTSEIIKLDEEIILELKRELQEAQKLIREKEEIYGQLLDAAEGLSVGVDWNKGTQAQIYRPKLIEAVKACHKLAATSNHQGTQEGGEGNG